MASKRKFRVGWCSRLLILAALFWFSMQLALVPKGRGTSHVLRRNNAPTTRSIVYVHIGKTGGEWIKTQLSIICKTRKNPIVKRSCLDSFQGPNVASTKISSQTVGYLHTINMYPRNLHALATHYLFSVRHPLTRLISWYVYNHPQSCDPRENNSPACQTSDWKRQFFKCFPEINDLGNREVLFANQEQNKCSKILWDGWYGRILTVKDANHLYWNYNFYWNQTMHHLPEKSVLVVRQESLLQDMNDLEVYLGGSSDALEWRPEDSKHYVTGRVGTSLTVEATRNLCCALDEELKIYYSIVQRAENLNEETKHETLKATYKVCGVEQSWNELDCPTSV